MFSVEPHVADVRLRVNAQTREELFTEAMRGLYSVLHVAPGTGARPISRHVVVDSVDLTALMVDFLNEILSRVHIGQEVFAQAKFATLTDTEVACELTGIAPAELEADVKAVTYHEADVHQEADGSWTTMLVLDI
ncbi:MAG TPA: archease [Thermoanaerobaculia bacterium]